LLVVVGLSFCFFGCVHKSTDTYQNKGMYFPKPGKIAIMKFNNIEFPASGQEAANLLSFAFMQKGYSVIDASNVLTPSEQDKIYTEVLTPEVKAKFKNYGVNAIVLGTMHDYSCTHLASRFLALFSIDSYTQYCRVIISVKMIKLDSGEILWGVSRSGEDAGDSINAGTVLRSMVKELGNELPVDAIKQPDK
ncbi:MAG: hypothetical protein NTV01_06820, partial [Bacteroidia bacterium]|nr:hypothetical protein [Bacteroidia bacterium]